MLDISGNGMGDVGARLLAKALQINTRFGTVSGNVYTREAVKNYLADFSIKVGVGGGGGYRPFPLSFFSTMIFR